MANKKLNRTSEHRKALLKNMLNSLVKYEQIKTTLPKAKFLKPQADKLITLGKKDITKNVENGQVLLDMPAGNVGEREFKGVITFMQDGEAQDIPLDVVFENDYSQPISINYVSPGKKGPDTGRPDLFRSGDAKQEIKPKGDFAANDVEVYATDPDGGFDTEDIIVDTLDDMMEGKTRQMEEFATGKKVKNLSRGEGRVIEAEVRAEQASDAAAEAAAEAADEFASGGIARMLGE